MIPSDGTSSRGRIYVLWHQHLFAFVHSHRGAKARILVSSHKDGEMLALAAERLGFKPIRGSTRRGGVRALKELLADVGSGFDYGLTPDGPTGPREIFQAGAVYFASKSGLALVPTTVTYSKCWRLPTWDRFVLPVPFARGVAQFGEEVEIPSKLDSKTLETWRQRAEESLTSVDTKTQENFEELFATSVTQKEGFRTQQMARS